MPALPDFDIAAKPLKGFDVMNLPLTKTLSAYLSGWEDLPCSGLL